MSRRYGLIFSRSFATVSFSSLAFSYSMYLSLKEPLIFFICQLHHSHQVFSPSGQILPISIFSSSAMLIEKSAILVNFGLGIDYTSAFRVNFNFVLQVDFVFALEAGFSLDFKVGLFKGGLLARMT